MREKLASILDLILAMPPESIIGFMLFALLLASPVAAAYAISRRGAKDPTMVLVASATMANIIGMAVASGLVWNSVKARRNTAAAQGPRLPGPGGTERLSESLTWLILEKADTDADKSISSGEAAAIAAQSVKGFAGDGKDSIDAETLKNALRAYLHQARMARDYLATRPEVPGPGPAEAGPGASPKTDKELKPAGAPASDKELKPAGAPR